MSQRARECRGARRLFKPPARPIFEDIGQQLDECLRKIKREEEERQRLREEKKKEREKKRQQLMEERDKARLAAMTPPAYQADDDVSAEETEELLRNRPRTRGDCEDAPRPCPFVGCKHHLYLDVHRLGNIQFNFPRLTVEDLKESCVLDVTAHGPQTLEKIGELLNVTRERVRQIIKATIQKGGRVARTQGFKNPYKEETSDPYTWRKAY